MSNHYWEYFLSIEYDLVNTSKYVEFNQNNENTYSIEFARILLASSAEVDVIAKLLYSPIYDKKCKEVRRNISHHKTGIVTRFPSFTTLKVQVPKYELILQPWHDWSKVDSPFWWTSYNNVKHERDRAYNEATLKNALYSVAGLLCIVLYYYKHEKNILHFETPPKLLYPEWHGNFQPASLCWSFTLPD